MKTLIYTLLASALLSACSCRKNDTPSYTLSGQYLEDCNLKPKANTSLYLENESTGEKIAEANTKPDGSFSLEYKTQNGSILNLVDATSDEVIFKEVPINKDHSQTVFVKNFVSFNLWLDFQNNNFFEDTFFLYIFKDSGCTENVDIIDTEHFKDVIVVKHIITNDSIQCLKFFLDFGNSYKETMYSIDSQNNGFAWGIGYDDFNKSRNSGVVVNGTQVYPDNYHRFTIDHSPYPAVNEYTLVIE